MEQKRYTLLPKQTVDNWVEAIGINKIPDEVSEILSEDITYHIRELVHKSIQIMKHSRRSYLSVDDINSALRESDTDPIFGHSGIEPFNFKAFHTKEGAKVCYLDEKDVNLRETAFDSSLPNEAGETSVKANWLVLEGYNCNSRGHLQKDLEPPLNEVMSKYLQNVTRALISEGDQLRKVALDDLCSNKKLQIIIPHLISFCSTQIKQHTGKETFPSIATHIISTINALVKNHSVILTPYLIQLAKILLFTLMEAKIEAQHWYLHQKAATVLSLLARRHPHSSPDIREQLLKSYLDTFTDPTSKQMAQLHGALCGVTQLGITAITNGLFPKIFEKMEILQKHLTPIDDLQDSPELLHVTNQLNETLSILFQSRCFPYVKHFHKKTSSKMSKLYAELNELFGESFVLKCNLNAPKNPEPPVNDNLYNSLVTPLPPKQPSLANDQDNTNGKFLRYETLKKTLISRDYNIKNTNVGNITVKTKWRKKNLSKTNILNQGNFISDKRNNQSLTKTTRGIHKSYGRKKRNISQKIYLTML